MCATTWPSRRRVVARLGSVGGLMLNESIRALRRRNDPNAGLIHRKRHTWAHGLPIKMRFRASQLYVSAIPPFVIGAVVGVLAAVMGVGGGFIMVPAMIYLLGIELSPMTAVGGPLVVATCTEFTSLILLRYIEERRRGLEPREAIDVTAADYAPAREEVELPAEGAKATIVLRRGVEIRGTAYWADGSPLEGGVVECSPIFTGRIVGRTQTGADGSFRIENVGEGHHEVRLTNVGADLPFWSELVGATIKVRPCTAQSACSVLPRPMSSASRPPRPQLRRNASQLTPVR